MIPEMKLTSKGAALLAKVPAGAAVPVTKWQIGTGALTAGSSLDRAALVAQLKELPVSSVTNEGSTATILGQFTNTGMEAFPLEELGLMATDPDEGEVLICYGNAFGAGEQIQAGTVQLREFVFGTELTFSGEANVTAVIQPALVFIPQSEKGQPSGVASLGSDGKVLPEQLPEMDVSTAMADFETKDSLGDADGIVITDNAAENAGKRVLWSKVKELLGKLYVPLTRKINNKALSADITLSAADVGAAAASHTHALDALTGILPVNKGGTGQSSLEALLAALKQAGAVQIATGSYVGTGTFGADHPCSLTFDFVPKMVFAFAYYENPDPGGNRARYIPLGNGIENNDEDACLCVLDTSKIGTDYTAGFGLGYIHSQNSLWAKKSPDGRTVSWYNAYNSRLGPEMYQFNTSGWEFFFAAIG